MQSKQAVTDVSQDDKQAIRDMVHSWLEASKNGDNATLLTLMADDVLFITPGNEPFGNDQWKAGNDQMKDMKMEADIDIKEIEVAGPWAWMRSFLKISITPPGGETSKLAGHILTILQKQPDGRWVIKRDANFVQPEKPQ
ncbi:MAG TPA: SgcJ/EcaC family oxidoreductase [Pyrinomonadaceae bacterium]|nr:SgcJ/EcaC family oxidoreductase [Pyrinomonadaceae bacterium]